MEVIHLNQKQLAARWHLSEASLERWRTERTDLKLLKLPGQIIYRTVGIEAFEESCLTHLHQNYQQSTYSSSLIWQPVQMSLI